jgi:hypothetical protein
VIAHMVWRWTGLSFSHSVTSSPYVTGPVQPAGKISGAGSPPGEI